MSTSDQTSGRRAVDPARLASGSWCRRAERMIGQGDINASYSADRIGMGQPIKKPFAFEGKLWVCVGNHYRRDSISSEAYRLVHPSLFEGAPQTYAEKTLDGDAARGDPLGFYHGMTVRQGGTLFVLVGPPVTFVAGQAEQLTLF